jgi:CheY-like chemotaxis protein
MAKVMLVEDDNSLLQIYADRLAAEGYQIITAKDGEEALALAIKERPDLIIADIMMPKVSGLDMLDILRSTTETKDIKIIMMTALSQAEDKLRAEKLGADKYLVKSQVTLEDVAREAADMLAEDKASTDSAVSGMTGDKDLGATPAPQAAASAAAAAKPAETPRPQPSTSSIPVTQAPNDLPNDNPQSPSMPPNPAAGDSTPQNAPEAPAPTTPPAEPTKPAESSASTAENLGKSTKDEESAMKDQIDSFIESNPTLTANPDTNQAATPQTPPATPAAEPKKIPITEHQDEPSTEPSPPPEPTKNEAADKATQDAINDMLDSSSEEAKPETKPAAEPEKNQYVDADPKNTGSENAMKHTKRIEPDDSISAAVPDINELLAKEGESNNTPPPVGTQIVPGGGSVSQLTDSSQNPIPQQQPGTNNGQQNPPTNEADPNHISL